MNTIKLADFMNAANQKKPDISFTDFVDFYLKSGPPRATHVRQIKERGAYEPAFDFYKRLREAIVELHSAGRPPTYLDTVANSQTDPKKIKIYPDVAGGYKKFLGHKNIQWFQPPSGLWAHQELTVRINPELGLHFDDRNYVVKLYFKDNAKITKQRAAGLTHLMYRELASSCPSGTVMAVLDVRNGQLHTPEVPKTELDALIMGEAASFLAIWKNI